MISLQGVTKNPDLVSLVATQRHRRVTKFGDWGSS